MAVGNHTGHTGGVYALAQGISQQGLWQVPTWLKRDPHAVGVVRGLKKGTFNS